MRSWHGLSASCSKIFWPPYKTEVIMTYNSWIKGYQKIPEDRHPYKKETEATETG
jgi:hypothetical protein